MYQSKIKKTTAQNSVLQIYFQKKNYSSWYIYINFVYIYIIYIYIYMTERITIIVNKTNVIVKLE